MLGLKCQQIVHRQQVVGVLRHLARTVDHACWGHKMLHGNGVHRVVGKVTPRDPMDGCIKMGAGMLATGKIIPIPTGAAGIVVRRLFDAKRPALAHLGGQRNLRKVGREGLGQVNDLNAPRAHGLDQGAQQRGCGGHAHVPPAAISRSNTLGLSRQRCNHSWATSPG